MGAVANLAPDLFAGIHAGVPFVDPLTSILDPSLPLTVIEWDEWGDPLHDPAVYAYMKSYSPVENVGDHPYPRILATTSLNDTRVLYVEPAKWVARLREVGADVLLKTEMSAGHGGVSGRYAAWHERAFELAWMLDVLGLGLPDRRPSLIRPSARSDQGQRVDRGSDVERGAAARAGDARRCPRGPCRRSSPGSPAIGHSPCTVTPAVSPPRAPISVCLARPTASRIVPCCPHEASRRSRSNARRRRRPTPRTVSVGGRCSPLTIQPVASCGCRCPARSPRMHRMPLGAQTRTTRGRTSCWPSVQSAEHAQ